MKSKEAHFLGMSLSEARRFERLDVKTRAFLALVCVYASRDGEIALLGGPRFASRYTELLWCMGSSSQRVFKIGDVKTIVDELVNHELLCWADNAIIVPWIRRSLPKSRSVSTKVYVIQRGLDGPIKVGVTFDVSKRILGLQTGSSEPLVLLFSADGGRALEAAIHKAIKIHRLQGEWFKQEAIPVIRLLLQQSGHAFKEAPDA